jgi:hypothetical protein
MNPASPRTIARTREILQDLEAVRENMLALSDDIWAGIDRQDLDAFDEGVQFMRSFVEKNAAFDRVATDLSVLVQQFMSVRLEESEKTGSGDQEQNERIIAELNREEPHLIDQDFTFKRPFGFIFDGEAATGVTTWQRLYELICKQLFARDEALFRSLEHHAEFISNRGNHTVSSVPSTLRKAMIVGPDLFIESNLSANSICTTIRRLLAEYGLGTESLKVFLRQDRDAGREHA